MRLRVAACVVVAAVSAAASQDRGPAVTGAVLKAALQPALPFPEARPDGTPADDAAAPAWTVRWPPGDQPRMEVLANPLNPGNRERALKIEEEIQKSAMQSQRRSQSDYEKALGDFQRTGKVGEIREITLRDDGLAGERYDAESQLTIEAQSFDDSHAFTVATSRLPEALRASGGPAFVIRVPANVYTEGGAAAGEPGVMRYCAEQAWVFFGALDPPAVTRDGDASASVSVTRAAGAAGRGVVVWIRGNVELVDRVLQQADWSAFRAGG